MILLPFLGYINFRLGEIILGLRPSVFERALLEISPESKPLFLAAREPQSLRYAQDLLVRAGFNVDVVKALPQTHDFEIPLSWIRAANPFPPLLAEFAPAYARQWNYVSFGYLDKEGAYRQVTSYGGEADSTPSLLVAKARGQMTRGGDYFVDYLFRLSRELEPQPELIAADGTVRQWRMPEVYLDAADWRTYRGGSYDGLEEIEFTCFATVIEVALIGVIIGLICFEAEWSRRDLG